MSRFKKATREKLKLRMAIDGPSGSGKSFTGLRFAFALGKRVACIDTENKSLAKYQGLSPDGTPFDFDVLELTNYAPSAFTEAITEAGREGYDVILVDSLSHAWGGEGGALELKDKAGQSWSAWKDVTPLHNRMVDSILKCPAHIICTMRSKTDYVPVEQINAQGRKIIVPQKVGMAPIQRPGMEYEFDVYASMDWSHILTVTKSRCPEMQDQRSVKPGAEFIAPLVRWLDAGVEPVKPKLVSPEQLERINSYLGRLKIPGDKALASLEKNYGVRGFTDVSQAFRQLTEVQASELEGKLKAGVEKLEEQVTAAASGNGSSSVTG